MYTSGLLGRYAFVPWRLRWRATVNELAWLLGLVGRGDG